MNRGSFEAGAQTNRHGQLEDKHSMAWIKTVKPEEATGELKAEYDRAALRAGKVFNILEVQSLNLAVLRASTALYVTAMFGPSGLSRADREMLATVVSWANHCFY
jgi:alkylhydroperoxidase family enzyme